MTPPRQLLPGSTYHVVRRTNGRQKLLRPSAKAKAIFNYCLAEAVTKFNIEVNGFLVMSNHWHLVVKDLDGTLPKFLARVHSHVAKCVNKLLDRKENFWASGHFSAVRLETPDDILQALTYALTNPVKARAVKKCSLWPGANSFGLPFGKDSNALTAERPSVYFRKKGPMPETASMPLIRPTGFEHLTDEQFGDLLRSRVEESEHEIRQEGGKFLGAHKASRVSPYSRPGTREPKRDAIPRIAAKDPGIRARALERLRLFVRAYNEALRQWRDGIRDVVFPPGTYWMRLHFGVACASPEF